MPEIPEVARKWFDDRLFVTLATVEPDGRPHLSVLWTKLDGDDVLMSTVKGRRKHQNLERDPRATVLATDPGNPYSYLEVRGTVEMTEEGGRELIDSFAETYRGERPYPFDGPDDVRVVLRLRPEKVVFHG